jgi:hypothetical protein
MQKLKSLNWKTTFTAALALLAAAVLLNAAFMPGRTSAQNTAEPSRTISVNGSGQANGSPDIAYVNLGVDVVNAEVGKALDQANTTINAVAEALKGAGVDAKDIQTSSFNVYPEDRVNPQTGQPSGERAYRVQNTLNVTVRDITKVGAVIDVGLKAGANSLSGLNFGIADMSKLEQEARLKAVADAKARAEQLAAAFGVKVGAVVSVRESRGNVPGPAFDYRVAAAPSAVANIQVGQLAVNVDVDVTFAIIQ